MQSLDTHRPQSDAGTASLRSLTRQTSCGNFPGTNEISNFVGYSYLIRTYVHYDAFACSVPDTPLSVLRL